MIDGRFLRAVAAPVVGQLKGRSRADHLRRAQRVVDDPAYARALERLGEVPGLARASHHLARLPEAMPALIEAERHASSASSLARHLARGASIVADIGRGQVGPGHVTAAAQVVRGVAASLPAARPAIAEAEAGGHPDRRADDAADGDDGLAGVLV